jgi:MraZ protein
MGSMAGSEARADKAAGPDGPGVPLPVFRGVTLLALDAKSRLAIPARHRDALADVSAGRLILTVDPGRCLLLYPFAAWEPIERQLIALSAFDATSRGLQRLLVGHAEELSMDGAGRILVSPALRRFAGLDHQVVLVGQGHKFEVWDEARWSEQTDRTIATPVHDLPPELAGIAL